MYNDLLSEIKEADYKQSIAYTKHTWLGRTVALLSPWRTELFPEI